MSDIPVSRRTRQQSIIVLESQGRDALGYAALGRLRRRSPLLHSVGNFYLVGVEYRIVGLRLAAVIRPYVPDHDRTISSSSREHG